MPNLTAPIVKAASSNRVVGVELVSTIFSLNISLGNIDVGLHANTAKIDVQFSHDRLRPGKQPS